MHQFTPSSTQYQLLIVIKDIISMTLRVPPKAARRGYVVIRTKPMQNQPAIYESMPSNVGGRKQLKPLTE
jgi:hypothetical protein